MPKERGRNLQRLGGKKGAKKVSDVTVVFISRGLLCGYYRNATVFADPMRHPDRLKAGESEIYCCVKVKPKNAFLIPVEKRKDKIQHIPKGQSPVIYGDKQPECVDWFEKFTQGTRTSSIAQEQKLKRWGKRVERSSPARKMALDYYGNKCECCGISCEDEGDIRAAVFQVHHKKPYAENFETRDLKPADLAVLCANCHLMIHKMSDVADIKGLREYLNLN